MKSHQALNSLAGWLVFGIGYAYPSDSSLSRRDSWDDHMKKNGYPSNADVCKMVANADKDAWTKSKASDYFGNWFYDRKNKMDDWLQQMHKNATAHTGKTPGDIDCTILHSQNCQPLHDADCETYNPAAFAIVQTEAVNIYSILDNLDIASIKNVLLEDLKITNLINDFVAKSQLDRDKRALTNAALAQFIISGIFGAAGLAAPAGLGIGNQALVGELKASAAGSGIGASAFTGVGGALSLASNNLKDGVIDVTKLKESVESALGDWFQMISDTTESLAAKIFGGSAKVNVKLAEFAEAVDPGLHANGVDDQTALLYLLQTGYFMDQQHADRAIKPLFNEGFKVMRAALIGYILQQRQFYVLSFDKLSKDKCSSDFEGASRYVDGKCFILKRGGKNQCVNHDDNAPTEVRLMGSNYNINLENFFRNVADCNNDRNQMVDKKKWTWSNRDNYQKCFFGLVYLHTDTPSDRDLSHFDNSWVRNELGLRTPSHWEPDRVWC
ncbi:uncharacterized protein F4822DRAFT_97960 [Hypoxylon trugodes]|uniref:uncharacterized protein n=1 Tax=Hypoxylon trugodes TaxID=326681 RepID=UPI00219F2DF3|nr:uncharacterized protein F4822DRAFT_97960 [Hypoxylon trugodes]KAI1382829.1 hypothetical protein F4822DRAFT_97960 [Hypoxylon trugodes]